MTQVYATTWSSLLLLYSRPLVLTGVFRDLMAQHFQANQIEDPRLRDILWQHAPGGKILIESAHRWKPVDTEKRPAIIVKRNRYANIKLGIGNRLQGGTDLSGEEHYSTFWSGSHTLFCFGASGAQAEILSSEVQRQLTEFAPQIMRQTQLKNLAVVAVDDVGQIEEADDTFVVPVTVGYVYEENWSISQHSARLSKISLSTILNF